MFAERHSVTATTVAAGTATAHSAVLTGRVLSIIYTKDATAPYAAGVDFTITAEATGQTLWAEENVDASKTVHPRTAVHSTAGAAQATLEPVTVANDRVQIVLAAGGDTKTGTFEIVVG